MPTDGVEDLSPNWWGFKYGFVSGGLLGAGSARRKSLKTGDAQSGGARKVFCEDDQENLYKLVQVCLANCNSVLQICYMPNSVAVRKLNLKMPCY